jgi:hypothetical protein
MEPQSRVVLVGELNPYSNDQSFALYPLPRSASGDRLRKILGLTDRLYLSQFERINLCTGRWSSVTARRVAGDLVAESQYTVFVLLGRRVQAAFNGPSFFDTRTYPHGNVALTLPHPSGRNLVWNYIDGRRRARECLSALAPWLTLGVAKD